MQTKKLKEWFNEIILGETIFRKLKDYKLEDRGKEIIKVLSPSAIKDGRILDDRLEHKTYDSEPLVNKPIKKDKYTQLNDIVLKLIEPYSAVLIDKEHIDLVVPSFCIILRGCKEEVVKQFDIYKNAMNIPAETNVRFIHAYLNCPIFLTELKNELDSRRKKGRTVTLSKPIVSELEIPLFSRSGRVKIIESYNKLSANMALVNQLIDLQREYFITVFDQVSKDNLSDTFEEEIIKEAEQRETPEENVKDFMDSLSGVNKYEE